MNKYEMVDIVDINKENFNGTVYDLEVEDDHSYTVNDIAVHNSACMTRKNTGVGIPQLYAIQEVHEEFKRQGINNVATISDGGITSPGDVAKAFKYSDFVMVGGYISGTTECPGSVFKNKRGELYKVYAGSASGETKVANGKTADFVEGIAMEIPFRGHVKYMLKEIKEGVQSAFSYVGASNMQEFKEKCEFIEISDGGRAESKL
jgi:IMP dehydrogenase/GMP reductase